MNPLRRAVLIAALLALPCGALAQPAVGDDMSMGDAKAKVVVVEYASVSCGHCAKFNTEVFPAFKKKYVDTGLVRYELREFLTAPAELAAAGFMVARCAGPKAYFAAVDDLFRNQEQLYMAPLPTLVAVGGRAGLDEAKVKACLADKAALDRLNIRVRRGVDAGVRATPTFLVNGVKVAEGEMTLAQLDEAIAAARK